MSYTTHMIVDAIKDAAIHAFEHAYGFTPVLGPIATGAIAVANAYGRSIDAFKSGNYIGGALLAGSAFAGAAAGVVAAAATAYGVGHYTHNPVAAGLAAGALGGLVTEAVTNALADMVPGAEAAIRSAIATVGDAIDGLLSQFFRFIWGYPDPDADAIANMAIAGQFEVPRDPLVLDLDGDGIEVSALDGSAVYFDYDSDGVAERTGWVSPDDGMLAYDANGNGIVDGIHELFGSPSQDGFEVLETLDANQDGVLDASDPAFAHLRVWRDLNQNGVSDSGELQTVGEAGITSFNLARTNVAGTVLWRASSRKTAAHFSGTRAGTGHDRGFASTFTRADGSTGAAETIYFQTDRQSTADPTPTFTYLTGINVAHGALGEPMTSSDRTGQWPPSFRFPARNDCPAFVVRSM